MRGWIIAVGLLAAGCTPAEHKAAEQAVQRQLSDPSSAQFRNVVTKMRHQSRIVCGEVNAKNMMGGYVGFRAFVYMTSNSTAYVATDAGPDKFPGC